MTRAIAIAFPLVLGAIAVVAAASGHGDSSPPRPVATIASGSFDLENSRGDMPIFAASDIGPGDGASGTVTIANDGDEAGELTLSQHDVDDTPGAGGGLLSRRMSMRIREVGGPKSKPLYDGALAPMPALELGPLEPGQSRVFEFDAALPESGTPAGAAIGDNAFQGAALSAGYSWTATELPPAPPVTPLPTTSATGSPGASTSTPRKVQLTILRIRAAIWHRRLVLWAYFGPGTCRVLVRLRFKAHRSPGSHGRALGSVRRERLITGSQKLVFKLSPKLRRALRATAEQHARATVSAFLVLRDREAEPATAGDAVRLRHLQPAIRHGRR